LTIPIQVLNSTIKKVNKIILGGENRKRNNKIGAKMMSKKEVDKRFEPTE